METEVLYALGWGALALLVFVGLAGYWLGARPKAPPPIEFDAFAAAQEIKSKITAEHAAATRCAEAGDEEGLRRHGQEVEALHARMVLVRRRQLADQGKTTDPLVGWPPCAAPPDRSDPTCVEGAGPCMLPLGHDATPHSWQAPVLPQGHPDTRDAG